MYWGRASSCNYWRGQYKCLHLKIRAKVTMEIMMGQSISYMKLHVKLFIKEVNTTSLCSSKVTASFDLSFCCVCLHKCIQNCLLECTFEWLGHYGWHMLEIGMGLCYIWSSTRHKAHNGRPRCGIQPWPPKWLGGCTYSSFSSVNTWPFAWGTFQWFVTLVRFVWPYWWVERTYLLNP